MTTPSVYQMSQGLDVLAPKPDKAYPIPCRDWDVLKRRVGRLSDEPFLFQSAGSAAIGAAISDLVAILTGSVTGKDPVRAVQVAWALAAVLLIGGLLALYFASKERGARRERASDIVEDMGLIEERYDKEAASVSTESGAPRADNAPSVTSVGRIDSKAQRAFKEVTTLMPTLIEEMRSDLTRARNRLVRDFVVLPMPGVIFNTRDMCFVYYQSAHENLMGMIAILDNHGFITQRTVGDAPRYRMSEEFVRLLLS